MSLTSFVPIFILIRVGRLPMSTSIHLRMAGYFFSFSLSVGSRFLSNRRQEEVSGVDNNESVGISTIETRRRI